MAGIQVNPCKNPRCANFGVPPKDQGRRPKSTEGSTSAPGDYVVIASGRGLPMLRCELCRETIPMQSNLAIAEELMRISAYLEPQVPTCPSVVCLAYGRTQLENGSPTAVRFGSTSAGTPRYRCQVCRRTYSFGGKSTTGQGKTHVNRDIFMHLMNSMPIRRIIKVLGISPSLLYQRIDFLYAQCQGFAGERERTLLDRRDLGVRYLAIDRQKLLVNWSSKQDRRNTLLLYLATADLVTGYVLAGNLNYDGSLDASEVEKDATKFGDLALPIAFRRFARVWLPQDYEAALRRRTKALREPSSYSMLLDALHASIEVTYAQALAREDIEAGDGPSSGARTPPKGMQLHEGIVMSAHVQLVARLLQRAETIQIFSDQESGIRAAIMAAHGARIKTGKAEAYYVSIMKETTIDAKRVAVLAAKRQFKAICADNPGLSEDEVQYLMMLNSIQGAREAGVFRDRWANHPFPDMREPAKKVCWLTDQRPIEEVRKGVVPDDIVHSHLKATLAPVDRYFMQIRRGITLAERGIPSASTDSRLWFGKNAYNPQVLVQLLEIFRTYFNYCEVGEDGCTPAMRLGLAKGPVSPEDIIYWTPRRPGALRRRDPKKEPLPA